MNERAKKLFDCDKKLLEKFKEFHKLNPDVYKLFKKFAIEAKGSGRQRFSHWMIANRIRWYTTIETRGSDYKLSNDFIALYARLLIYHRPEFEGFFLIKKMKNNED
jgi:hypothetical protein